VIFIREGSGKLFGWFGGGGFEAACQYFTELKIPWPVLNTIVVSGTEFFGGLALAAGFLTRLAVIPLSITMGVAIVTAHLGGGWGYPTLIIAVCAELFQVGAGPFSLDRALSQDRS
jgi:putative oxidoreductase